MQEPTNEEKAPSPGGWNERVRERIQDILTTGEIIHHLVRQRRMIRNLIPDTVILTNRRLILYRPRLMGRVVFEHHPWRTLANARLREGVFSSTLSVDVAGGESLSIDWLPKPQARRLYGFAQDREERAREEWEGRELESRKVAAREGMSGAPGGRDPETGRTNPFERLRELTAMRDEGLITPDEFESKRAEVISRM